MRFIYFLNIYHFSRFVHRIFVKIYKYTTECLKEQILFRYILFSDHNKIYFGRNFFFLYEIMTWRESIGGAGAEACWHYTGWISKFGASFLVHHWILSENQLPSEPFTDSFLEYLFKARHCIFSLPASPLDRVERERSVTANSKEMGSGNFLQVVAKNFDVLALYISHPILHSRSSSISLTQYIN
jgi:hypothetical protein